MAEKESFNCIAPFHNKSQIVVSDGLLENTGKPLTLLIKEGEKMKDTLQIVDLRTDKFNDKLKSSSKLIFSKNSSAKIIICTHSNNKTSVLTEEIKEIQIEENAEVDILIVQNEHSNSIHKTDININMKTGSSLNMVTSTFHGGETINQINVNLDGERITCEMNGICIADESQRVSNTVNMNHLKPNCNSNQLFKVIVNDKAISRFDGLIKVVKDAQKTEAYQVNNNLIFSDESHAFSKPHLEIYADDVQCSHGATFGSINEEQIFYMRSRGISIYEAKLLQQLAFANQVLEKVRDEDIRTILLNLVEKRLRGEISICDICNTSDSQS
ncbi:MAG: Fe-S cluster assembly protein SufD [Bacteroidales bacterium]